MIGSQSQVTLERHGSAGVIRLESPGTRNALTLELRTGLARCIDEVKADSGIRAVVLTGTPGTFCSGGDLKGMRTPADRDSDELRERMLAIHALFRELLLLDKPLIAAVDGAAYGGGFSLALTADIILVTPRARFSMVFAKVGLVPDCCASFTLPRAVGVQRARELFMSAREVDANEALRLGIALEQHASEVVFSRAVELADAFTGASPLATKLQKRLGLDLGAMEAAFEAEANAQALCLQTTWHKEAVRRFVDKEPPAFRWPSIV